MFAKYIESLMNKDTPIKTKEKIVDAILQRTKNHPHEDILTKNKNLISALINLLQQKEVTDTTKKNIAQIIQNLTKTNENRIKILNDNPNFGKILNYLLVSTDVPAQAKGHALKIMANFIPNLVYFLQQKNITAATKRLALYTILECMQDVNIHTEILNNSKNIIQILTKNFIETEITDIIEISKKPEINQSELAMTIIRILVKLDFPIEKYSEILKNNPSFIPMLISFLYDEKALKQNKQFAIDLIHRFSPTLISELNKNDSTQETKDNAANALKLLVVLNTTSEKILKRNPNLINVLIKLLNSNQTKLKVQECAISIVEKIASHSVSRQQLNVNECNDIISSLTFLSLHPNTSETSKAKIATTISQLKNDQGTKSTVINSTEGSNKRGINAQEQEGNKKHKPNKFTNYLPGTFKKN